MRKPKVYRSTADLPPVYLPVEVVEKNFTREAAAADRRYGPHVAALVPITTNAAVQLAVIEWSRRGARRNSASRI